LVIHFLSCYPTTFAFSFSPAPDLFFAQGAGEKKNS